MPQLGKNEKSPEGVGIHLFLSFFFSSFLLLSLNHTPFKIIQRGIRGVFGGVLLFFFLIHGAQMKRNAMRISFVKVLLFYDFIIVEVAAIVAGERCEPSVGVNESKQS